MAVSYLTHAAQATRPAANLTMPDDARTGADGLAATLPQGDDRGRNLRHDVRDGVRVRVQQLGVAAGIRPGNGREADIIDVGQEVGIGDYTHGLYRIAVGAVPGLATLAGGIA
jgi:hypothetical protein